MKSIQDVDLEGKTVLCRMDYNVPIENGVIKDDTRILTSLPTINYILEEGASLILMSHLGRPKNVDKNFSLEPISVYLSSLLEEKVVFSHDLVGEETTSLVKKLKTKKFRILLLENTRFHEGETKNDKILSEELSKLADIFVSDAFGTVHRAHASTNGVAQIIPGYAGILLKNEYEKITKSIDNPSKPSIAVIGGAKISSKLFVINHFVSKMDSIIIGGGMAFTFLAAMGINVGESLIETTMIERANQILDRAKGNGTRIYLPIDLRIANSTDDPILENDLPKIVKIDRIGSNQIGLDIGNETEKLFLSVISKCNTIVWNGPMGVFEDPFYQSGTKAILESIFNRNVNTVVGGGDTLYAINMLYKGEIPNNIHLSTGGGATLELMSGLDLPGISCLNGYNME